MVLNEKHNEQNQGKWLFRAKRERMELSASVEEALEDAAVDEISWGEEPEVQADSSKRVQEKGVFPPRLSLQSRPVPALRNDISTEMNSSFYPAQSSEEERNPVAPVPSTNILKRFAQRLTSSFTAIGGASSPEVIESSRQFLEEEEEGVGTESVSAPNDAYESVQLMPQSVVEPLSQERVVPQRPLSSHNNDDEPRDRQSKQRLAGRTTRIHLETPPITATTRSHQSGRISAEATYGDPLQRNNTIDVNEPPPRVENDKVELLSASSAVGANLPERASTTNSSVPAITRQMPVGASMTGARLPTVDVLKGKSGGATRRELSGSGIFEPGQGDATVVNRYVTEASVVLVTLTANPGPVVIQYVTLRPRIGFTVHLTAPTTMRSSFNYIVLLGELF